jgi:16S rRNA (guanine527-N7)-methyltransferase
MTSGLQRSLMAALERPHRLGTIGGDLEEQLAHCASFSSVLAEVMAGREIYRGVDLGTGGGLPGVALAAYWPATRWTLVDMRTARADEVERTVLRLGFGDRVEVRGIEAQHLAHDVEYRETFDVAVARSFGPPSLTAECAAGFVRVGGLFLISEPPDAECFDEQVGTRWDRGGLTALGFSAPDHVTNAGSRFAVFEKQTPAPDVVPRRPPRGNRGWFQGVKRV